MAEIQSLARGLTILQMLSEAGEGAGITDMADRLGIDKGSASRLLQTLAHYGYAEKDPDTRKYRLGPQVVALSRSVLTRMPLREVAKPFLRRLVDLTGECAHLAVPARDHVLYIDQVESPATLRVNAEVGSLVPFHCTALGKALLAFGAAPLPEKLSAHTARTITDFDLLGYNLEQTRKQGYAIDDEEFDYGVRCIAVPIYDYRERVIAALGISGPAARMPFEQIPQLARSVVETGQSLSDRMRFKHNGNGGG